MAKDRRWRGLHIKGVGVGDEDKGQVQSKTTLLQLYHLFKQVSVGFRL